MSHSKINGCKDKKYIVTAMNEIEIVEQNIQNQKHNFIIPITGIIISNFAEYCLIQTRVH